VGTAESTAGTVRVDAAEVRAYTRRCAVWAGVEGTDLDLFVEGVVGADLRGIDSHGVFRVPFYARGLRSGDLNPRPNLRRLRGRGATELLDADNGLGVVVGQRAMRRAVELALEHGIGLVGVTNSNHAGMLACHVLHATDAGMIGSFTSNAPALMAPWGGRTAMLSNSPFAWAIPSRPDPIVLDMACSNVARGRIRLAASRDQPIPPDWATDADGAPTTDPHAAMEGLVLPIAGYKGYGLALVNEILAAALPGAILSVDVSRRFLAEGATSLDSWGVGHLAMAIDVAAFGEPAVFVDRVAGLADRIRASATASNAERILLPGDLELEAQRARERDGIPMTPALLGQLRAFADEAGVDPIDSREVSV